MKLQGVAFQNGSTCKGMSFANQTSPLDMAKIEIDGRYPESGWARNLESHEMVYVLDGRGSLTTREGAKTALATGDVIYVPSETWFAWDGDMTILMACSPVFNSEQYEIEEVI